MLAFGEEFQPLGSTTSSREVPKRIQEQSAIVPGSPKLAKSRPSALAEL
jgi:hypothetical protein